MKTIVAFSGMRSFEHTIMQISHTFYTTTTTIF